MKPEKTANPWHLLVSPRFALILAAFFAPYPRAPPLRVTPAALAACRRATRSKISIRGCSAYVERQTYTVAVAGDGRRASDSGSDDPSQTRLRGPPASAVAWSDAATRLVGSLDLVGWDPSERRSDQFASGGHPVAVAVAKSPDGLATDSKRVGNLSDRGGSTQIATTNNRSISATVPAFAFQS